MRKILLIVLAVLLFPFIRADTISDFNATDPLVWDQPFSMQGFFSATDSIGRLCSFFIYDQNQHLLQRLSDEYTVTSGYFTSTPVILTEPTFDRNADYNAVVRCGTNAYANKIFHVVQRKTIDSKAFLETEWFFDPRNVIAFVILLVIVGGVMFFLSKVSP